MTSNLLLRLKLTSKLFLKGRCLGEGEPGRTNLGVELVEERKRGVHLGGLNG